ncbi:SKP1-like protein 4 [Tanacetum coccineum]
MICYCKKHTSDNENKEVLEAFEEEFVKKLDDLTLTHVSYAAKYLDIKSLQELCDVGLLVDDLGEDVSSDIWDWDDDGFGDELFKTIVFDDFDMIENRFSDRVQKESIDDFEL